MAYAVLFLSVAFWVKGPFQIALGLPIALFLPGYSLVSAFFPRKEPLGGWQRLALSLLLQILVVPGLGFVLNFTPWGLRPYPILVLSSVIIIVGGAVAYYRRLKELAESRFDLAIPIPDWWWPDHARPDRILTGVVLAAVLVAGGAFVYAVSHPIYRENVTEFYVLGSDGRAGNYAEDVKVGEKAAFTLGVVNQEQIWMIYELAKVVDGVQDGDRVTIGALAPGVAWQNEVDFLPTSPGLKRVEFLLYVAGQLEPYREIHLWVNVRAY